MKTTKIQTTSLLLCMIFLVFCHRKAPDNKIKDDLSRIKAKLVQIAANREHRSEMIWEGRSIKDTVSIDSIKSLWTDEGRFTDITYIGDVNGTKTNHAHCLRIYKLALDYYHHKYQKEEAKVTLDMINRAISYWSKNQSDAIARWISKFGNPGYIIYGLFLPGKNLYRSCLFSF